jgi:ammonia channel protein AmtB
VSLDKQGSELSYDFSCLTVRVVSLCPFYEGGTTALISTYLLGSRRGRFYDIQTGEPLEHPKPMPGHSVSLQLLGTFILWFGWFGFNPGSALLLGNSNPYQADVAALCAVNTFLSSAAACVSALACKFILTKSRTGSGSYDLIASMNGTLSGLVAVSCSMAASLNSQVTHAPPEQGINKHGLILLLIGTLS